MEYKGSSNLDYDSDDTESTSSSSSHETSRPVVPAAARVERGFFGGVLFDRQEDRERSTTEVARGVVPGAVEPERSLPPIVPRPEFLGQPPAMPEVATEDDEDEESEQKDSSAARTDDATPVVTETAAHRQYDVEPVLPPSIVELVTPFDEDTARPTPVVSPLTTLQPEEVQPVSAPTPDEPTLPRWSMEVDPTSPDQDQPEVLREPGIAQQPTAEFVPPPAAGGGENTLPPPPPERPVPSSSGPSPEWERRHEWATHAQQRFYNSTYHPPQPVEYASQREVENVRLEFRRKMAARSLLFLALGWYLGHRPVKQLRKEVSSLQEASQQQKAELTNLTYQHQEAQSRIAEQNRQIEQFTRPQAVPFQAEQVRAVRPPQPAEATPQAEQAKLLGENGEEIILQPGQRLERAGSYSIVVDEHNRLVHNAVQHGDEYKRDRLHERPPIPFGAQDARYTGGVGAYDGGAGGFANQPMASSGASQSSQYALPMNDAGQTPGEEAQHLLPSPKQNPVVSAIASPWLWLGVGILLIAFFAAATI